MMLACAGKPAALVFMISAEPKAHDDWFPETGNWQPETV